MTARLSALLLLTACAPQPLSLRPPEPPPSARDYPRVRDRWTREGRIFSIADQDTVLIVSATLRSPEFQHAYAARYLSVFQIGDPAERRRILDEELRKAGEGLHFLVRTAAHSYPWADLGPTKGLWRVTLLDDEGRETTPAEVEQVRARREELEVHLYGGPDSGLLASHWPFVRSFHLRFPAQRPDGQPLLRPGTRRLTLRFAGPKGRTDLLWTLKE